MFLCIISAFVLIFMDYFTFIEHGRMALGSWDLSLSVYELLLSPLWLWYENFIVPQNRSVACRGIIDDLEN